MCLIYSEKSVVSSYVFYLFEMRVEFDSNLCPRLVVVTVSFNCVAQFVRKLHGDV